MTTRPTTAMGAHTSMPGRTVHSGAALTAPARKVPANSATATIRQAPKIPSSRML